MRLRKDKEKKVNLIIPYNPELKVIARKLRKNSTLSEVLLWQRINKKQILDFEFHRQVPIDQFIVDFYCHEASLVIEIDGDSHNDKYEADCERQHILESKGVNFLRFQDLDVKTRLNDVVQTIYNYLEKNSPFEGGCHDSDRGMY